MYLKQEYFNNNLSCYWDSLFVELDSNDEWVNLFPCCKMDIKDNNKASIAHIKSLDFIKNTDDYINNYLGTEFLIKDVYAFSSETSCCQFNPNHPKHCDYTFHPIHDPCTLALILGNYCNNNCVYCCKSNIITKNGASNFLYSFIDNFNSWSKFENIELDGRSEVTERCLEFLLNKLNSINYKGTITIITNGIKSYMPIFNRYPKLITLTVVSLDTLNDQLALQLYGNNVLPIVLRHINEYRITKHFKHFNYVITDLNSNIDMIQDFINNLNLPKSSIFMVDATKQKSILKKIRDNGVENLIRDKGYLLLA